MNPTKAETESKQKDGFAPVLLINPEKALSQTEAESLRSCEKAIAEHLDAFIQVAQALLTVKNQHLYRGEFASFEEYCRQKWGYTKTHAYRLVNGAEVVMQLSPMGDFLPKNERQVRPLTGLPPHLVQKAWAKAIEMASPGEVTGKIVKMAVSTVVKKRKKKLIRQEMWQSQLLPLLRKALAATRKNAREEVEDLMQRINLMLSVGNRPMPEELD